MTALVDETLAEMRVWLAALEAEQDTEKEALGMVGIAARCLRRLPRNSGRCRDAKHRAVSGIDANVTGYVMAIPSGSNNICRKEIDVEHVGKNTKRHAVDSITQSCAVTAGINGGKIERLDSIFVTGLL